MQLFNKNMFNAITTCFMVVLLCISCPLKRELKQNLGLMPVSQPEFSKVTGFTVCADYRKTQDARHQVVKKQIDNWSYLTVYLPVNNDLLIKDDLRGVLRQLFAEAKQSLFILYRKILI